MKARLMLAVPLMVGVALAQSPQRVERAVAKREWTIPGRFAERFPIGFSGGSAERDPSGSQARLQSGSQGSRAVLGLPSGNDDGFQVRFDFGLRRLSLR